MSKRLQREAIKDRLKKLQNKDALSKIICDKVEGLNLTFDSIFLYKAMPSEVNVDLLIEKYINTKTVYLPKVVGDDMYLVKITNKTTYDFGPFGIREPQGDLISPMDVNLDLCITPLLGFDTDLNRLGKGKGYYDRFFNVSNPKIKLGVAFEAQKVDKIDAEPHDVKLDIIVTEEKIYENNSRKI